jgi:hypothetical protein
VVGVLVLVDEDVPEPASVVLGDGGHALQQRHRLHDQVVEVERVRRAQPGLVDAVDLGHGALVGVGGPLGGVLGGQQLVLQVGDLRGDRARGELLRVQLQIARDQPDQPAGVVGVVDGERGTDPEVLGFAAQDAHAHRVERRHPHRTRPPAHERVDPLLHLGRGLVGEGDRHHLAGVHAPLGEQPRDPVGEHAGLARTRPGHDEQR